MLGQTPGTHHVPSHIYGHLIPTSCLGVEGAVLTNGSDALGGLVFESWLAYFSHSDGSFSGL